MSIVAKIGERSYEVIDIQVLSQCRAIYAQHTGNQNSLEDRFEELGIDFVIDGFKDD